MHDLLKMHILDLQPCVLKDTCGCMASYASHTSSMVVLSFLLNACAPFNSCACPILEAFKLRYASEREGACQGSYVQKLSSVVGTIALMTFILLFS